MVEHEQSTAERATSPAARSFRAAPWQATLRWVTGNTFVPSWLPESLCRPAAGYVLAFMLEVVASLATLALVAAAPRFSFFGMLNILAVALVALSWGAAPSLLATFTGTILLEIVVLPGAAHGGVVRAGDAIEIGIALAVGIIISLVASSTEQARRRAISERVKAQAREMALRETNARTDEFLSIASHELRSPLTSLKAALQLSERRLDRLTAHEPPPADWQVQLATVTGLLATAQQQVDRQNRLVGDLLDVSRIRANKLDYHLADCDLAAIVSDAVDEQRLSWPERPIALDVPNAPIHVSADAHRIGQVITNYLTNALKYSPADTPVDVALVVNGAMARVSVRDHGPGLTPEQRAHIWDRFHRVPGIKQQSGTGAGLGLGLHIARTIIEYHGGEVGIDSAPGAGSTFWFALPLPRA